MDAQQIGMPALQVQGSAPNIEHAYQAPLLPFLDVRPDQFPDGCDVVIMRPGQLEPAGTVHLDRGVLLMMAMPEVAEKLRPAIRLQQQREMAIQKAAQDALAGRG